MNAEKPSPHLPELSQDDLKAALLVCRARSWPADLDEVMRDPLRASAVRACALGLRRKKAKASSAPAAAPLPQGPLLSHWPPRRATPTDFVDRKRAAAGDRDD